MSEVKQCIKLLKVSKSFRQIVRDHFRDIYNIPLGFCSEIFWFSNTWPLFNRMVVCIETETQKSYQKNDIELLFDSFSLFMVSLHFFLCRRSCDKVEKYCKICSRVRDHNYDSKTMFHYIVFEDHLQEDHLGLSKKMIYFDVHLRRWSNYNCTISSSSPTACDYREQINYARDIYLNFVSVMVRVRVNLCYEFFVSSPLTLAHEKYIVEKIERFANEIIHMFWTTNTHFFFEVFDHFRDINRSICYEVNTAKPEKGPYTFPMPSIDFCSLRLSIVSFLAKKCSKK